MSEALSEVQASELSTRALNVLHRERLETWAQVKDAVLSWALLPRVQSNFGWKTYLEVCKACGLKSVPISPKTNKEYECYRKVFGIDPPSGAGLKYNYTDNGDLIVGSEQAMQAKQIADVFSSVEEARQAFMASTIKEMQRLHDLKRKVRIGNGHVYRLTDEGKLLSLDK